MMNFLARDSGGNFGIAVEAVGGDLGFDGIPFSFEHLRELKMMDYFFLAFSVVDWFWDSWYELRHYATHLNKTQWAIMAAASVLFGFVCLKGNTLKI
ncbi:hypothetical protein RSSM_06705 [Rhodopirellula sallentina SM41]|uniref:Uncharacterized protein n=3 Tax=Rhodopirellula TaxID=265488 RepID=M5TS33_9BACT|nr:hypothetical protein RSSM_06705 [Rhodopirellula sallentina SM41]